MSSTVTAVKQINRQPAGNLSQSSHGEMWAKALWLRCYVRQEIWAHFWGVREILCWHHLALWHLSQHFILLSICFTPGDSDSLQGNWLWCITVCPLRFGSCMGSLSACAAWPKTYFLFKNLEIWNRFNSCQHKSLSHCMSTYTDSAADQQTHRSSYPMSWIQCFPRTEERSLLSAESLTCVFGYGPTTWCAVLLRLSVWLWDSELFVLSSLTYNSWQQKTIKMFKAEEQTTSGV